MPSTTENINANDVAIKSHARLNGDNYVQYIEPPKRKTQYSGHRTPPSPAPSAETPQADIIDLVDSEMSIQRFWPESRINATYQENWIG